MSGTVTPTSDLSTFLGTDPGLERLYDNVQAVVPAVLLSMIKMSSWNAIEEFSLRSSYFRDSIAWLMAPGITCVDFNPYSADFTVCWILEQRGLRNWRGQPPSGLIDLRPPLDTRQGTCLVALKPTSFITEFPPELFTNWFETILDGTLYRLYAMPSRPWSNAQLAQYHARRFGVGINRARDEAKRMYTNQSDQWRFPYFARGRRKQ